MEENIKTAKQIREEHKIVPCEKLRGRIWWLIKNSDKIKDPKRFEWVAKNVLDVVPNTLSRKLSGVERHFDWYEIEALKLFFGEEAMDIVNYAIVNNTLVKIEIDNDRQK